MKYISLLRGINVSGQKKIKMEDLKTLYESLDLKNVMTYIQSGNVMFECDKDEKIIIAKIENAITQKYAFSVPVQVRNMSDFEYLHKNVPFSELDLLEEGTRVLVTFLADKPTQDDIDKLLAYVKEPERLVVAGREVYLHCPQGYGKTKLNNNFLENKLKVRATTRNWNSVVKLLVLARG